MGKSKEYLYFVGARFIAVLVKPFLLWLLLSIEFKEAADLIALFYLIVSSVMVIFNNEAHFDLYKELFKGGTVNKTRLIKEERSYYERLIYHIIIFAFPVFLLSWFIIGDLQLSLVFFLLLVLEKTFDEIQRLLQFEKRFLDWSILFVAKSLTPLIICLLVIYVFDNESLMINCYFISSFVVGVILPWMFIKKRERLLIIKVFKSLSLSESLSYFKVYRALLFKNQLQAFSMRNVPLLDRIMVRFLMPGFLPQISVISQLGSISIMLIDYFVIAHRRKEYLEEDKNVFDIVAVNKLLLYFVLAYGIYLFSILSIWHLNLMEQIDIEFRTLILIGLYYAIFSINQHFAQFNFWRVNRKFTLMVDLLYYLGGVLILISTWQTSLIMTIVVSVLIAHFVRFILSVVISINKTVK